MRKECAWQRMLSWLTETVWSAFVHSGYKMVLEVGDFKQAISEYLKYVYTEQKCVGSEV